MKPASERKKLLGLDALGARLRGLREKAGLSQMELARRMGFNPTHGYKYVLRLEKGLVANPTLRTIAGCLEACGAGWTDIADVLPGTGAPPAPEAPRRPAEKPARAARPKPPPDRPPAPAVDPRPLRVRLRSDLIARRAERAGRYWQEVAQAEEEAGRLMRTLRVLSSAHHDYIAFVRPCCSVIQAFASARPGVVEHELDQLVRRTAARGLDAGILEQIRDSCLRHVGQAGTPPAR